MKTRSLFIIFCFSLLTFSCGEDGLNLFSVEQDVELGMQLKNEVLSNPQQYPVLDRNQYNTAYQYVEGVVAEILASDQVTHKEDFAWEVYIIRDDSTLNAFAAPGGYIFVYTGILKFLDMKDDFAGVLAHEMAHADRRHSTKQLTKAYGLSFLLDFLLGDKQNTATDILASLVTLQFSRSDESDADKYSVNYLCGTNYAANGAASFFAKLIQQGSVSPPEFLSTHPNPDNRVSDINEAATSKGCDTKFDSSTSDWRSFQNALP